MSDDKEESLEDLISKIDNTNQLAFLEQYPRFKYINKTAEAVGIADSTVRGWYREDVFTNAFNALKKDVQRELIEAHEQNIDDVCLNEKTPAQSRIFGSLVKLRALDPNRYRDNMPTKVEHEVIHTMRFVLPDGKEYKAKELPGTFKEIPQHIDVIPDTPQDVVVE